MKLLAIDSSGLVASVALLVDDVLVGEYTIHNKKTHSQTLLPMIADMLAMAEVDKHELTAIAVAAGPGSFTGLRIGAATAKGLAQALEIPVVPVSTLEGLAYNLQGTEYPVCPIMDARRSQAYYGIFDVSGKMPVTLSEEAAEPIEEVIEKVRAIGKPTFFLGDGVPVFKDRIVEALGEYHSDSDASAAEAGLAIFGGDAVRYQRASSLAALGRIYMQDDRQVSAHEFVPRYLRMSQAERELKNKR